MKFIRNISLIALSLFIGGGMVSCKKDYLDTRPTDAADSEVIFESLQNLKGAVNGLSRRMKAQYIGSQGFNGEGTIKMYYGNYSGNHFSTPLPGWSSIINLEYLANPASTYTYYPWYYYYTIIGNANAILKGVDRVPGDEKVRNNLKAQTLSFRAYCYMMLVQLYGDRWADSNNGATSAVVLKVNDEKESLPLSSLADAYKLIYKDLDEAIALFTSSGIAREANYQMNSNVAYAIYARAALNKQDYVNAEKYAALARKGFNLMGKTDYLAGFANPTSEWIWSIYDNEQETIFFWSYGAYIGYNSSSNVALSTPRSISKELYETIPATDIRKDMFLNPKNAPADGTFDDLTGQGNDKVLNYVRSLYPSVSTSAIPYSYMQFKIKVNAAPGVSNVPNFRSSEMLLIEAEAKYFQQKSETEVQNLLVELNKSTDRDPNYSTAATGKDLLGEIKKYRAIELWGEGFDFFDLKRWGDPINRKSFSNGGNFQDALALTIEPEKANKWKLVTPQRETDFNDMIK